MSDEFDNLKKQMKENDKLLKKQLTSYENSYNYYKEKIKKINLEISQLSC